MQWNEQLYLLLVLVGVMVFNAPFNNISVISCPWPVSFIGGGTGGHGENHWQTLSHNVVHLSGSRTHNISGDSLIGTNCIGSCKSNYHRITTAPFNCCKFEIYYIQTIELKKLIIVFNGYLRFIYWKSSRITTFQYHF